MAARGVETIVGITQDPSFGPLVLFGLGGVTAELLGRPCAARSFRSPTRTRTSSCGRCAARRCCSAIAGGRRSTCGAVEELLLRVGLLADEVPEVTEMDLNPVIVHEHGAVAVDIKVRCSFAPERVPADYRQMRTT